MGVVAKGANTEAAWRDALVQLVYIRAVNRSLVGTLRIQKYILYVSYEIPIQFSTFVELSNDLYRHHNHDDGSIYLLVVDRLDRRASSRSKSKLEACAYRLSSSCV